jgi:hypothetical protein
MSTSVLARRAGSLFGKCVVSRIMALYERRCSTFALTVSGTEHLQAMDGRPYLLVANHILIPQEESLLGLAIRSTPFARCVYHPRLLLFKYPPDSFILRRIVRETTNRALRVVSRGNMGVWSERSVARAIQEHVSHPFSNGLREGLGHIAVDPTGRYYREFLQSVAHFVEKAAPIVIFPGKFENYQDILCEGGVSPGAAHLARKFGLPIVPAYVSGAANWRVCDPTTVAFGAAFSCHDMSKQEINRQIVERVRLLRDSALEAVQLESTPFSAPKQESLTDFDHSLQSAALTSD